eukprot:symbB.v1.2.042115.t1/scaffold8920.1/size4658/1
MLSMTELDRIKGIDKEKGTITVQAGARVSQILAELQKHGLTLENFSSITVPRSRSIGMLSMTELDRIKGIDKEKGTITVQAGARVSQILAELQKHGLTLENFSSIT